MSLHRIDAEDVLHFEECWQHSDTGSRRNMIAATRELLAGTAVCEDFEHAAAWSVEALTESLDIMVQDDAIAAKG